MIFWRHETGFKDYDFYDFEYFQDVITDVVLKGKISLGLSPYELPQAVITVLSNNVYDYCYGKMIDLKNTDRWVRNFSSELSLFFLENGRYLQSLFREYEGDIYKDNTSKTTTSGDKVSGGVSSKKNGNVSNSQNSNASIHDGEEGRHEIARNETYLYNQSTSTNYLGTRNIENLSNANTTKSGSFDLSKTEQNDISISEENAANLNKEKSGGVVDVEGTINPVTIAKMESDFTFREWLDELLTRLDTYFMSGGSEYA